MRVRGIVRFVREILLVETEGRMPYPPTIKTSERPRASWEGDESSDPNSIPQRRSSISAPGELNYRHANSANNLTRTNSVSADEIQHELSTPKVNLAASAASSRVERGVERLARERQEREQHLRSNGCYSPGDEVDRKTEALGENGGMVGGGGDGAAERLAVAEPQSSRSRAGAHTDGYENSGKPHRNTQRLLVVANRLPVSAIPLDGDKWDLQLSAGGLVSALLGMAPASHNFYLGMLSVYILVSI